ncbi:YdbC family protein [Aminicella lysinilytica]|uniref:YdbC family protein n=1 Tax=Aminicella lysinilytica TaxID=433323 RepID=UPI002ED1E480
MANTEIRYEIKEYVGTVSRKKNGWNRELNIVSWNGQPPKYDLREWSDDHSHMGKGITLFADEMKTLVDVYTKYRNRRVVDDAKADEAKRNEQYWNDRNSRNYNNNAVTEPTGTADSPAAMSTEDQQIDMGEGETLVEGSGSVVHKQGTLPDDGLTDEELAATVALGLDGNESVCAEPSHVPF